MEKAGNLGFYLVKKSEQDDLAEHPNRNRRKNKENGGNWNHSTPNCFLCGLEIEVWRIRNPTNSSNKSSRSKCLSCFGLLGHVWANC